MFKTYFSKLSKSLLIIVFMLSFLVGCIAENKVEDKVEVEDETYYDYKIEGKTIKDLINNKKLPELKVEKTYPKEEIPKEEIPKEEPEEITNNNEETITDPQLDNDLETEPIEYKWLSEADINDSLLNKLYLPKNFKVIYSEECHNYRQKELDGINKEEFDKIVNSLYRVVGYSLYRDENKLVEKPLNELYIEDNGVYQFTGIRYTTGIFCKITLIYTGGSTMTFILINFSGSSIYGPGLVY